MASSAEPSPSMVRSQLGSGAMSVVVHMRLIYDRAAGGTGGQAKSYYMAVEPPEIPLMASCIGLEMVH